jgi:hypothetical protein
MLFLKGADQRAVSRRLRKKNRRWAWSAAGALAE